MGLWRPSESFNFRISSKTANQEFKTHLSILEIHVNRERSYRDNRGNVAFFMRSLS